MEPSEHQSFQEHADPAPTGGFTQRTITYQLFLVHTVNLYEHILGYICGDSCANTSLSANFTIAPPIYIDKQSRISDPTSGFCEGTCFQQA